MTPLSIELTPTNQFSSFVLLATSSKTPEPARTHDPTNSTGAGKDRCALNFGHNSTRRSTEWSPAKARRSKISYSLRTIILFTNTDVSTIKIYLDISILAKNIMGRRKYLSSSPTRQTYKYDARTII
jgi:hypothetical protein